MEELKSNNNLLEMGDCGSSSGSDSDPSGDDLPPTIMKKIFRKEKNKGAAGQRSKPQSPSIALARKNNAKPSKTAEEKKQIKDKRIPGKAASLQKPSHNVSPQPRRNSIFNLPRINRGYTPAGYPPVEVVDCGMQTDKEPSYTLMCKMRKRRGVSEVEQVAETEFQEMSKATAGNSVDAKSDAKKELISEDKDKSSLKEDTPAGRKHQRPAAKTQSIDLNDPTMESTCSRNPVRAESTSKPSEEPRVASLDKGNVRKSFQQCYRMESVDSKVVGKDARQREVERRFGVQSKDFVCLPCISIRDHLAHANPAQKLGDPGGPLKESAAASKVAEQRQKMGEIEKKVRREYGRRANMRVRMNEREVSNKLDINVVAARKQYKKEHYNNSYIY